MRNSSYNKFLTPYKSSHGSKNSLLNLFPFKNVKCLFQKKLKLN